MASMSNAAVTSIWPLKDERWILSRRYDTRQLIEKLRTLSPWTAVQTTPDRNFCLRVRDFRSLRMISLTFGCKVLLKR